MAGPLITKTEFVKAVTFNGYPAPTDGQYEGFNAITLGQTNPKWELSTKKEAAMFLANAIHETGGLVHKQETEPPHAYRDPKAVGIDWDFGPDDAALLRKYGENKYYGRGYLQLSWLPNYRRASQELFSNDKEKLVKDPDFVLREDVAWLTAAWFWKTNVWPFVTISSVVAFRETIRRINPAVESGDQMRHRINIYKKVCEAFTIDE